MNNINDKLERIQQTFQNQISKIAVFISLISKITNIIAKYENKSPECKQFANELKLVIANDLIKIKGETK